MLPFSLLLSRLLGRFKLVSYGSFIAGGDSKTLMITQVAPVRKNEGETICSLNFAQRVRNVELGAATRRFENGDMVEVCIIILLSKIYIYISLLT